MKIALIHYRMLLKGGLETRLFSYIDYFKKRGDEVTVIICKKSSDIEVPKGIRLVRFPLRWTPKKRRQIAFDRAVGAYMQSHRFDFSLSLGRTSHQDAVLAPGNHPGYLAALGQTQLKTSDRRQIYLDTEAYKNSRYILAASEMMKREVMQHFGEKEEKIHVLYPPIDTQRFHVGLRDQRSAFRKKHGFSEGKSSFLFVSTGHKRKGLPLLLQIFAELPPERFELIIAGSPPVNSALPHVKYAGFIAASEELYAATDFTIHPSIYEPYGQVVAESLQCGAPVLVSNQVGASEIVEPNEGIVLNNFEVKNWVEALKKAVDQKFEISPDFAAQKKIRLEDHMQRMLEITGHA